MSAPARADSVASSRRTAARPGKFVWSELAK